MRPPAIELISKRSTKFSKSCINSTVYTQSDEDCDSIGGVIRKGCYGWLARGPIIEIFSLKNGNKISSYRFDNTLGFERCFITCVTEIDLPGLNYCLLAIGVQFGNDPGGMVAIFSIQDSKILRCIETADKVTSCHVLDVEISARTILELFQGCLVIGTDTGKVILLDLSLKKCEKVIFEKVNNDDIHLVPCHVVLSTMDACHIKQHCRHSKKENVNFGIQLEVLENAGLVLSLQSLRPLLALAAGLEDGRMILYDLSDLQPFHLAYPPEKGSPLVKLSYMEPPDDPRACIYIWAFHENPQTSVAVMHSVMYDNKATDDDNICLFERFQSCGVRLTLPMYERGSIPISCQSIAKFPSHESEETISLCLLAWKVRTYGEVLVFDINQWYKEQMPNIGDWRDDLSYLASFPLKDCIPLDVWIDESTIAPFNSIQRPEEHFFPISLSFDSILLQEKGCAHLHWPGLQNRTLEMLNFGGPSAILEPSIYFDEISKASLNPQFLDYHNKSKIPLNTQREILLSVALEYNCFGLLKECAKCWADGSHLGRKPNESLSLSTLTEWIWSRAESIKSRCNTLCIPLFDHSGHRIDQRSQKELSHFSRQLKLLADLLDIILKKCREYIPDEVYNSLLSQCNSIRMASEYQEVLQWLLNVGLLPEAITSTKLNSSYMNSSLEARAPLIPYPYKMLRNYYMTQRMKFYKMNAGFVSQRTQSCRLLYIDSFIEHECNANALRDHWLESGGNGLYPPPSLQAMLRSLLVPDVPIENKYILFVYLFLDLNMIEDERYTNVVRNLIKFPAVFKVNSSLIKTVQAFWNLDHGQFESTLEDIISPFSQERKLVQWQQELLIEALLVQDSPNLALRALQAPGPPISSLLELKTLLANDLVAEAFHLQRAKNDPDLLRTFLTGCLYLGKWGVLLDLALTEEEEKIMEDFLKDSKSSKTENLHFVYLLQRSKYVEAILHLDEFSKNKTSQRTVDYETPNLILSAYNMTMTPTTKHLSELYYNIRNKLKPKDLDAQRVNPLSSQLLKYDVNKLLGGIYHSSVLSTDEATNYWDEKVQSERTRLLFANNVPFIRRPQLDILIGANDRDTISYPEIFKGAQKRRLDDSGDSDLQPIDEVQENPKKRQRVGDAFNTRNSMQTVNTSLLTKFKGRSSLYHSTEQTSGDVTLRRETQERTMKSLSTPIIKSSREDREDTSFDANVTRPERLCTPQSILKVRSISQATASTPSSISRTRVQPKIMEIAQNESTIPNLTADNDFADEERSIRFDLPTSANITSNSSLQTSNSSLEMSQRVPSTSIVSIAVEDNSGKGKTLSSGPMKRKPLHAGDSSFLSVSADNEEFFSPQHSRETSLKLDDDKGNSDTDEEMRNAEVIPNSEVKCDITLELEPEPQSPKRSRRKVYEGPKPRQALKRSLRADVITEFESSRSSRRSKTPERTIPNRSAKTPERTIPVRSARTPERSSPVRKSARILKVAEDQSNTTSEQIPHPLEMHNKQQKSLSRLVLESNAIKATIKTTETTVHSSEKITSYKVGVEGSERTLHHKQEEITTKVMTTPYNKTSECSESRNIYNISTAEGELSFTEGISPASSFVVPKQILRDDSVLSESFTQDWNNRNANNSLMTTLDMSNFDETIEGLKPSDNLLTDSSMEYSKIGGRKSYRSKSRSVEPEKFMRNAENIVEDHKHMEEGSQGSEPDQHIISKEEQEEDEEETEKNDSESEMDSCEKSEADCEVISISTASEEEESNDSTSSSSSSSENDAGIIETATQYEDVEMVENEESNDSKKADEEISKILYEDIEENSTQNADDIQVSKLPYEDNDDNSRYSGVTQERSDSQKTDLFGEESCQFSVTESSDANVLYGFTEEETDQKSSSTIDHLNDAVVQDESFITGSNTGNTMFTDSSITNVQYAMPTNILSGEEEELNESLEYELNKGRIEATSTTLTESQVLSSTKDDVEGYSSIKKTVSIEDPTVNILDQPIMDTTIESSKSVIPDVVISSPPEEVIKDRQEEPADSKKIEADQTENEIANPQTTVEKMEEDVIIDIRLRVSDDENETVGAENETNKTKSPRKTSEENKSTEYTDHNLRSRTRRYCSIVSQKRRSVDSQETVDSERAVDSPIPRALRATSVPHLNPDTPTKQSKLRRRSNSINNPPSPSRVLTRRRSLLLSCIDEESLFNLALNSGRHLFDEDSEDTQSSSTMIKRTRKTSTSSVETPDVVTTPRSTRRRSILSEDNTQTPKRVTRRSSTSKDTPKLDIKEKSTTKDSTESLDDSNSSSEQNASKTKKVRKLFSKASYEQSDDSNKIEDESPEINVGNYSSSRRLTRNQLSVLEKSSTIQAKSPMPTKKITKRRGSKTDSITTKKDDNVSETESVVSDKSRKSNASKGEGRRVTRSASSKADNDDETSSIASSTKSKISTKSQKKGNSSSTTTKSKDVNLAVITEEDQESEKIDENASSDDGDDDISNHSKDVPKKKGRPKRSKK